MIKQKNILWVYIASGLFVLLNSYFMMKNNYYFNLLPLLLLIIMMAFFSLDKLMLLTVFLTPLSVNLLDSNIQLGLSLPTEPVLLGITFLFLFKKMHEQNFDRKIIRHPVSIAVFAYLSWIFISTLTSQMLLVSLKFFIARLWFVIPFYFFAIYLFKNYNNIRRFQWLYIISLSFVALYTLYKHAQVNFNEDDANWIVSPFYNDHTSYGAMLAMFFVVLLGFVFTPGYKPAYRFIALGFIVFFAVALVFSYTRAAWLSLAGAAVFFILMLLKIRFAALLLLLAGITSGVLIFWTDIQIELEQNKQDSSHNLGEHVQSMANISTDASNLERLNRWNSALRMFEDRPVFGFGPGTYQFFYAPYQSADEKTIISTNMADRGNAHSEYLGPLAEQGVLGMILMLLVVLSVIATGLRLAYRHTKETRVLIFSIVLGLSTYFIHGVLNNFLDTDKAAIPVWGFSAMLVAMDLYHSQKNAKKPSDNPAAE